MTVIAPGAYVRAIGGMYAGATGRVVSVHERPMPVGHSWVYAVVDVGEAQPITVYVSALELVGAVPTVEQERDAAIAERDRLRRKLEALRDRVMSDATLHAYPRCAATIQDIGRDIDAILRGES